MTFKIVARTQAASEAVSLLNFEPKVLKFPVLEATRLLVLLLLLESHFYLLLIFHYFSKNANNALENASAYWKIEPCPAFG